MFQAAYILDRRLDSIWFLAFPFVAVGIALACHAWLPSVVELSVATLVTIPHHAATWLRVYASRDAVDKWRSRIIVGPVVILIFTIAGLQTAPLTTMLLVVLWDAQHSIMQQHGFGRIYDFKAETGLETTGRFDLALHWVLYGNIFLTSPLFTEYWARELHLWKIPVTSEFILAVHRVSWAITFGYLVVYAIHVVWTVRVRRAINPVKLGFLFSSYFLWYFVFWSSTTPMMAYIAHRLMHGLQYIVFVHTYLQRRSERVEGERDWLRWLTSPTNWMWYVTASVAYAVVFNFIIGRDLTVFGLGVVPIQLRYDSIPELGMGAMSFQQSYGIIAIGLSEGAALVHYYFDAFIWKVRDVKVQQGL